MPRTNTTEMAVLGLLTQGARTGYDVRKACEEALVHFWSESYGQIYPVLRDLRERGLVERETVRSEGPTKHLYRPTEEGVSALRSWIAEPPQPLRVRNELLLKVFLGRQADDDDLRRVLRGFQSRVEDKHRVLSGIRKTIATDELDDPDAPYWLLTLDFGLRSLEAQAEWVRDALTRLPSSTESTA